MTFLSSGYGNVEAASKHVTGTRHLHQEAACTSEKHWHRSIPFPPAINIQYNYFSQYVKNYKQKMSCQQSLSRKGVVMNTFIFNVSTDLSGISPALKKLINVSDNFSSYELWHVNSLVELTCIKLFIWPKLLFPLTVWRIIVLWLQGGKGVLLKGYLLLLL